MCGIAGFIDSTHTGDATWIRQTALAMANSLNHRGPDDGDTWSDVDAGVGLGFRRLAIIDLSATGRQPMISSCQRYVITYNGEVYNTREIREELKDKRFRGHSDTELVLEACARWGVEAAVKKLNGMFAFALWDRQQRSLALVRDRLGIKPLYWGAFKNLFLFASEIKAIREHPGWTQKIDEDALAAFMRYRYIPAPQSIYKGIYKLEPGQIVTLQAGQEPQNHVYWDISSAIEKSRSTPFQLDNKAAIDKLDSLLKDSVARRMVADVPLGAFLSGGLDSASIVALMQEQTSQSVKTFTIGFDNSEYDESQHAAAIARHLGTEHTELYIGAEQTRDVIPLLPSIYDEPFADSSQIPTFLVSKMTSEHVTVALSGDGGDELFAGYNRYQSAETLRRWSERIQGPLRRTLIFALQALSPGSWDSLLWIGRQKNDDAYYGHKLHHLARILNGNSDDIYRELISEWNDSEVPVLRAGHSVCGLWHAAREGLLNDPIEKLQYRDTLNYLPDDILTKVDRASMAVSLEARTPLLDHRLVEFAWSLPMHLKIRAQERKWLLRQVLYRYVPRSLLDRPKRGFKIPLGEWLKGPLRDWAEHLLDEKRLQEQGYLDPALIQRKWKEHLSGQRNWKGPLWNVLMFQAWLEQQHR